eukprot:760561-Hanusia_phi.AAC.1
MEDGGEERDGRREKRRAGQTRMPSWKSIGIVATAALSCQVGSVEAYVSSPALQPLSARAGTTCKLTSLSMSAEERISRRAAMASTLLALPVLAAKSADVNSHAVCCVWPDLNVPGCRSQLYATCTSVDHGECFEEEGNYLDLMCDERLIASTTGIEGSWSRT